MKNLSKISNLIRFKMIEASHRSHVPHLASSLSCVDIIIYLYEVVLNIKNFSDINRDRFILSKGHASIGMYAVMYFFKYINKKTFYSFCKLNSKLGGHPDSTKLPLLNFSTGSLGHGLPNSAGFAYALKQQKSKKKIICLVGDQELMEGTTWESLHAIDNYKLNNLILIIYRNKSDFRSIKCLKLRNKLSVFCDKIYEIDGKEPKRIGGEAKMKPLETGYALSKQIIKEFIKW